MAWSLPTLQHLIPAEEFTWDPGARVFSLRNVLTLRHLSAGRITLPRLDVIAVLSGGRGVFDFLLDVVRVHDERRLYAVSVAGQPMPDPVSLYHLPFYAENVQVEVPGQYEVRLFVQAVGDTAGRPVTHHRPAECSHTSVFILEAIS